MKNVLFSFPPARRMASCITSVLSVMEPSRFAPTIWSNSSKIPFCFKIFSVNTVGFEVETLNFTPALFSASNSSFMPGYRRFSYTPFSL